MSVRNALAVVSEEPGQGKASSAFMVVAARSEKQRTTKTKLLVKHRGRAPEEDGGSSMVQFDGKPFEDDTVASRSWTPDAPPTRPSQKGRKVSEAKEVPDTQSDAAPPPLASAKPLSKKRRKASEAEPAPKKKRKTAASASEPHAPSDADVPSPQEPHDAGPGQDGRSARAPEEHEGPHAATGGPATADDTQAARKERNQRTLFLGKCPPGMQEEHVRRLFKSVGADCVEAVNVVLDWNGKPKGCAFVAFRSAAQAQQALATTPLTLFGRTIRASACREMQDDKDLRTVRLDHCPDFVTDLTLRNQFDGLQVQHVQHVTNRKGEHSGIVFVRFHSSRDAYAAAQKQFLDVAGKRIPISRM